MKFLLVLLSIISIQLSTPAKSFSWRELDLRTDFLIVRHALAPGMGDPADFKLSDCQTQRNLNVVGRKQAKSIGDFIKKNYTGAVEVYSSEWCRCLETAKILGLGSVEKLSELNSFFQNMSEEQRVTNNFKKWLSESNKNNLKIFITHQVNITALLGVFPQSGEVIAARMKNGETKVLERFKIGMN